MAYVMIVGFALVVVLISAVRGAGKPSSKRRRGGSWQGDGGGFGCGGGASCGGGSSCGGGGGD
ncbi:hypothetical protein [Streptomyces sp. NPDC054842]